MIAGEGLKETKDFFEQKWQPAVTGGFPSSVIKSNLVGSLDHLIRDDARFWFYASEASKSGRILT